MILGDENKEGISKVPQSHILGRHDPNKSISGHNGSLMVEKPAKILSDGVGGESSDNPHTQKLNSRNQRSDGDILPHYVRAEGSIARHEPQSRPFPSHNVFNYMNTSLIGLIAAKYQGKSEDPFIAKPGPSWSSLVAIVIYFLISLILMEFQSHLTKFEAFLSRVAFASGVLSSFSLISLLLPKLPGLILLYTSWALFIVISWWPRLKSGCDWLLTKITTVADDPAKKLFTGESTHNGQQGPTGENANSQQEEV